MIKEYVYIYITACLLAGLPAVSAQAGQQQDAARFCKPLDLVGAWVVVAQFPAEGVAINPKDPTFVEYQYFEFNSEQEFKHMTSENPITTRNLQLLSLYPYQSHYELRDDGVMKFVNYSWKVPMHHLCSLFEKDFALPDEKTVKAGDVVLYSFDKSGNMVNSRQLRRISK